MPKLFEKNGNVLDLIRRVSARQVVQQELINRGEFIDVHQEDRREETVAALGALITAITRQHTTLQTNEIDGQNNVENFTPEHSLLATMMGALANAAASGNLSLEQPPVPESVVPACCQTDEHNSVADFISTNLFYTKSLKGDFIELGINGFWSEISYHEKNETIEPIFYSQKNTLLVTAIDQILADEQEQLLIPTLISDHLAADEHVAYARSKIGCGIRLDIRNNSEIWVTCLSSMPLHVESFYLDREAGKEPASCIHKIYQQSTVKIYDIRQISYQMCYINAHRRVVLGKIVDNPIFESVNQVCFENCLFF